MGGVFVRGRGVGSVGRVVVEPWRENRKFSAGLGAKTSSEVRGERTRGPPTGRVGARARREDRGAGRGPPPGPGPYVRGGIPMARRTPSKAPSFLTDQRAPPRRRWFGREKGARWAHVWPSFSQVGGGNGGRRGGLRACRCLRRGNRGAHQPRVSARSDSARISLSLSPRSSLGWFPSARGFRDGCTVSPAGGRIVPRGWADRVCRRLVAPRAWTAWLRRSGPAQLRLHPAGLATPNYPSPSALARGVPPPASSCRPCCCRLAPSGRRGGGCGLRRRRPSAAGPSNAALNGGGLPLLPPCGARGRQERARRRRSSQHRRGGGAPRRHPRRLLLHREEERIQPRDAAQQGWLRRRSPSPRCATLLEGAALRDRRAGWRGAEDARPVERMRKEEEEYDVWDPRVSGCGGGELKKQLQFGE
ncbi:hypothetical protein PVAP13_9KG205085 [Panicum virgatum]|uniref:Uncharacterized protein n=1 Tax=Panicum virgatum TaxID=38727 RepID=A0A8T0NJV5_PANVG|nr:hypothetical protein PVAP13_9KG205085 [Panicum virgatum]